MRPIEAAVGLFISQGYLQLGLTILRSEYLITIYEGRKVPRGHSATQTPQTSEDDCRCSYKEQARGGAQLVPMRMHLDNYSFRNLILHCLFLQSTIYPSLRQDACIYVDHSFFNETKRNQIFQFVFLFGIEFIDVW